jgi:hypothetical protein
MVPRITDAALTGFKVTPSDTTPPTRLERLADSGGVDILLTHDAPAVYVSRGIVGVPVISAKRRVWMRFSHRFSRASASSVIIMPESTPKFQVFAALGSTEAQCREIWWPSIWSRASGTGHCSVNTAEDKDLMGTGIVGEPGGRAVSDVVQAYGQSDHHNLSRNRHSRNGNVALNRVSRPTSI